MSEKIIRIKSGNEEFTMNVTEESYEEWKENNMRTLDFRKNKVMENCAVFSGSMGLMCNSLIFDKKRYVCRTVFKKVSLRQ